jgi:steroid delta-isomerase-like uncharacterized protein
VSEENKAISRRFIEAVNQGSMDVPELFTSNFVYHDPSGGSTDFEGAVRFGAMFFSAFPDLHVTIDDEIADGDMVVTRWTTHGTHQGEFQGIPPSGREFTITGITILRIADGKIAEHWVSMDVLGMMEQIGAISMPGEATGA